MDVVERARRVATDVLAPMAATVDAAAAIPRSHLDALADGGLFGLAGPDGVDPESRRAVMRTLAGACGATTFVWAQHHGTTAHLAATENAALRDRWLDRCTSGEVLAGTAFAHLRRPGPPALRASAIDGGWRLDGFAPGATAWGLAAVYSVAAATDDGQVVWLAIDGAEAPGLRAAAPLDLMVMGATLTVELTFDGFEVADDLVLSVRALEDWRGPDRRVAARVNPGVLGVVDAARDLVAARASDEADLTHAALAADLAAWEAVAAELHAGAAAPVELAAHRDHRAQRLARERAFYVVQAQSSDGRSATLHRTRTAPPAATFSSAERR